MADRFVPPRLLWVDGEGRPVAGGSVEFYEPGSSTPKAIYTDETGATTLANPVTLNGNGYAAAIFGTGAYKVVLKDAAGSVLWTDDPVRLLPMLPLAVANGGTGSSDAADARAALGLGTAAVEDIGTQPGNVVAVLAGGQIDPAVVPQSVLAARGPAANLFLALNVR